MICQEIQDIKYLYVLDNVVCRPSTILYVTGKRGVDSLMVTPQLGSCAPTGVYAIPQNACFKAGFFWKLLGSLGFVPRGALLDEELLFFESRMPTVTPTAMRTASVNTEPMTCNDG